VHPNHVIFWPLNKSCPFWTFFKSQHLSFLMKIRGLLCEATVNRGTICLGPQIMSKNRRNLFEGPKINLVDVHGRNLDPLNYAVFFAKEPYLFCKRDLIIWKTYTV